MGSIPDKSRRNLSRKEEENPPEGRKGTLVHLDSERAVCWLKRWIELSFFSLMGALLFSRQASVRILTVEEKNPSWKMLHSVSTRCHGRLSRLFEVESVLDIFRESEKAMPPLVFRMHRLLLVFSTGFPSSFFSFRSGKSTLKGQRRGSIFLCSKRKSICER